MSIHALCPNLCATKLFWRTPYTTIEACNEHSSHAFYTTHTHPKEKDFWLPQQRSHQASSTPFFHSSFNLLLSYLAYSPLVHMWSFPSFSSKWLYFPLSTSFPKTTNTPISHPNSTNDLTIFFPHTKKFFNTTLTKLVNKPKIDENLPFSLCNKTSTWIFRPWTL